MSSVEGKGKEKEKVQPQLPALATFLSYTTINQTTDHIGIPISTGSRHSAWLLSGDRVASEEARQLWNLL